MYSTAFIYTGGGHFDIDIAKQPLRIDEQKPTAIRHGTDAPDDLGFMEPQIIE